MFCDDILALASVESYMLLIFRVFVVCFGVIKSRKHVQRNSMKLVDLKQFLWCSLSSCMISRSSVTAEFERENKPRRRCFFEDPSILPVFCVFHLRLMTQIVVSEEKPHLSSGVLLFVLLCCLSSVRK